MFVCETGVHHSRVFILLLYEHITASIRGRLKAGREYPLMPAGGSSRRFRVNLQR